MKLNTTFAGLALKNPIIISSSGLTNTPAKNKSLEEAGAAAIVLKSLFEEQIMIQTNEMATYDSPEADDYLQTYIRSNAISDYVTLIKESKKLCNIPIIASINCYSNGEWTSFATYMQEAGADAIELNIMSIETSKEYKYGELEQTYIDIVNNVKKKVSIPVIVKLASNLTNPIALINQLYANGVDGIVLFNRFYQPDININNLTFTTGEVFSHASDLSNGLRWTAIASTEVPKAQYAISGGVHKGASVIKAILAGASSVEVCSSVYKLGEGEISKMIIDLSTWMKDKKYTSIDDFKGKMNAIKAGKSNPFERTQFMKYFSSKE